MGEKLKRIEVWFKNGTRQDDNVMRAFPHAKNLEEDSETYSFNFGGDHRAIIRKEAINFVEIMDED